MYKNIIEFIRKVHSKPLGPVPLHDPVFRGNEKKYLLETIDSTYVSSVGQFVVRFEEMMRDLTGAKYAIAIVNGTCALHLSLILAGVENGDEVLTQPLTFVATVNSIIHANAHPHFVDVDFETLGMSPDKLRAHLLEVAEVRDGKCFNRITKRRISACVPMHTFGLPLRIDKIVEVCNEFLIPVVEDSTEGLGSVYKGKHLGRTGLIGTFSFNGNKIVTSGAGGAIITDDELIGKRAKHLSTTAKLPHKWAFNHDEVGYNYRMSNLNAALACAQLEQLSTFLINKRELADLYCKFFEKSDFNFVSEIDGAKSNYWLCCILAKDELERDAFLTSANNEQINCRPAWTLMNKLNMYKDCVADDLSNAISLEKRIVNLPSSVRL